LWIIWVFMGGRLGDLSMTGAESGAALEALHDLERHQKRRDKGIATVSVLAGPVATGEDVVRRWAEQTLRGIACPSVPTPSEVARALLAGAEPRGWVIDFLARWTGASHSRVRANFQNRSEHELELYLSHALPEPDDELARAACLQLLRQPEEITSALDRQGSNLLETLCRMAPKPGPIVLWTPRVPHPAEIETGLHYLTQLCQQVRWFPVAVVVEQAHLRAWLAGTPPSRARTMVREGLVYLKDPAADVGVAGLDTLDPKAWLYRQNLPAEVLAHFDEAARAVTQSKQEPSRENQDRARSAAERFLFGVLEAMPDTSGLFELNGNVEGIEFGPSGTAEIDLLSRRLRIALEVDGYYHFQEPERYRRDRRKDLALQKKQFLVVRCLAADVVERLEDILSTLRASVLHQKALEGGER
jgi:hypothetical protein